MPIRPLYSELAEKARLELNEDPNRIDKDLQHIKEWLTKQPHIRARTDDQWLIAFLRGCKYSLERTKEKLDLYYSLRTHAPELYNIRPNDALVGEIMDLGIYIILPKTVLPSSSRIIIIKFGTYDPDKYNLVEVFSVSTLTQQLLLLEDDTLVVAGFQCIVDFEGVTMRHFLQMTPAIIKKMVVISQVNIIDAEDFLEELPRLNMKQIDEQFLRDASPLRMKGIHFINTPPGFETVYNIIKSLLNEKNRSRLFVHNKNYEEMYKYIPKDILPVEYGGNAGTIREITEYWKTNILNHSSWFEEETKYGTDESKRPGNPKTAENLFGVGGSFRQLEFD